MKVEAKRGRSSYYGLLERQADVSDGKFCGCVSGINKGLGKRLDDAYV